MVADSGFTAEMFTSLSVSVSLTGRGRRESVCSPTANCQLLPPEAPRQPPKRQTKTFEGGREMIKAIQKRLIALETVLPMGCDAGVGQQR